MIGTRLFCAAILSACAFFPCAALAQAAQPPAAAHKLEFDAVSVRPSSLSAGFIGTDFLDPASKMAPPPGGLFRWNVHLAHLIAFAYNLRSSEVRQQALQDLPKPYSDIRNGGWFAIEARAEGNPARDDVRQMVLSMLEERFHLAAHIEKRDGEVFQLVVDKPGLGLKPHAEGEPCTLPSSVTDTTKYPHAYPPYEQVKVNCGVFNRELSHSGERRLEMLDVTMDQIANTLSQMASREGLSVIDSTSLTGQYDAVLEFAPPIPPNAETADDAIGVPQFSTALERQLGLKLVKQKAQVDAFVIDHIEPLSEN